MEEVEEPRSLTVNEQLSELQSKYQKVAQEYSKLRSQLPVLKKAFTEEQSKNNLLNEELKAKDQQIRIAESETDCLNFRNKQLTRRVTILQDELENVQNCLKKHSKSHSKSFDGPQFLHNFDEELSKKVAENATLIFTLNEYKERHELEVRALKEEIDALKLNKSVKDGETLEDSEKLPQKSEPYSGTQNHKNLIGETIKKSLEKQLFETQQTLQETIVERDRLKQKLKFHEDNMKNGLIDFNFSECDSDQTDAGNPFSSGSGENYDSSIDGSVNSTLTKESLAREKAIKRCYRVKLDELVAEKLMFKSKAETFEGECLSIKKRLEYEIQNKRTLEEQLEKEKENSVNAKEELTTTAANYELQLSTMSDHLAGLNDIIEDQKDQLCSLQSDLQKKQKK